MGPENAKHKVICDLAMAGWYLLQAKVRLEELEHPALGDIERLIERLREEQAELQRRNPK